MWEIVWVSPQEHRTVSVSRHFLLQAPQCPCSMWKRFSRDNCCRGRSKPGCRIVGSHTRWELTTWADFQLGLHRLLMSTGCKSNHNGFLDVSQQWWANEWYQAGLASYFVAASLQRRSYLWGLLGIILGLFGSHSFLAVLLAWSQWSL